MSHASGLTFDLQRLVRALLKGRASSRRALDLVAGFARGRAVFRKARRGGHVYVGGPLEVDLSGDVFVGDGVFFFRGMIATEVVCHANALLVVGEGSEFNYGSAIHARRSIRIGERCNIGSMVHIADESRTAALPVVIGDDVWIAHGAAIEPGAVIGNGSVVSACSVVTGVIPPDCLAVGNPARAVRLETMAGAFSR